MASSRLDSGLALTRAVWIRAAVVSFAGFLWVSLFWFEPAGTWPIRRSLDPVLTRLLEDAAGLDRSGAWAVRSWLFVIVPLMILRLTGRTPASLGLARSTAQGWRIVVVGFAVSLPLLVWLGLRPGVQAYYNAVFEARLWTFVVATFFVIVVEHVWIAGVMLAVALPGGRLPERRQEPLRHGLMAPLGFGRIAGEHGLSAWLGIPSAAWPALVGQALVFGAIHVGKDPGELLTAFPGGLALGIITYRVGSIWPTVTLHLATSLAILCVLYLAFMAG